jgi:4-hydroxy-tetrahydrodipicolinate synthase
MASGPNAQGEISHARRWRSEVTGFVPPLPTPLIDGRLDLESLRRMLDHVRCHVSGALVGGSVGEISSLTVDERIELMQAVAAHAADSMFLAVSISDNSLEHSRRLSEAAGEAGADLLVAACPGYFSNDRAMLEAYFAALSDLASAPLCLYDNPYATHTRLSVEDVKALAAAAPKLTHIKVTDLALDKVSALCRETDLVVSAGDDAVLWHQLMGGAEQAMVALPCVYPERADALWRAFACGDLEAASEEYRRVSHFLHVALGGTDYVSVIKAVLHHRGVIASPEVRLPLLPLSGARLREVIEAW